MGPARDQSETSTWVVVVVVVVVVAAVVLEVAGADTAALN
jgi:hypothetical protein